MITWAKRCFLIYLLTSPFYLFPSGGLQISTGFLALTILLAAVDFLRRKRRQGSARKSFQEHRDLSIFLSLALIINAIYYFIDGDQKFVLSSLYLLFNFAVMLTFTWVSNRDKAFLKNIARVFEFNIALQLLIALFGLARYHTHDTYRLMGTFNDPNQLAFYVFLAGLFIYVINYLIKKKADILDWLSWVIGLILIVWASSAGILLGVIAFGLMLLILQHKQILVIIKKKPLVSGLVGFFVAAFIVTTTIIAANTNWNIPILGRIEDKVAEADGRNFLQDRGLDTVIQYPQYLLFGAGEGDMKRFAGQANNGNEIHSSLIAIMFYYGLIPAIFLCRWLYKITKTVPWAVKIAFLAILVESLTLINYRQPLLWVLLILPLAQSKPGQRS